MRYVSLFDLSPGEVEYGVPGTSCPRNLRPRNLRDRDFRLLGRALEQSAHILAKDPSALRGQLSGRLMGISSPVLDEFLRQIRVAEDEGAWLRPLQPSLTPADSPLVRIFQIPGRGFSALAVTSDGRWAVSGSDDGAVRLWDLQGQQSRELGRHGSWVRSVALTSDGRWAVSGSSDGAVRLWDCGKRELLAVFHADAAVMGCTISSDGSILVAGDAQGSVHILKREDRRTGGATLNS